MAIISIKTEQPPGLTSVLPEVIYINTTDTYATVTATGYLTHQAQLGFTFSNNQMALVKTSDDGVVWLKVVITFSGASVLNTVVSLLQVSSPGDVVLPTIANHLMVSTDTDGTLANRTGTAINDGSLQAGRSTIAGTFISFPSAAASGTLVLAAVTNSSGNFSTTISNAAAIGQSQVISIPNGGVATSNFIISNSGGTQTIATGSLALSVGTLTLGSSTHASSLTIFPSSAANGTLIISAGNAGGAFNTTVTSGTMGQSTVYTIPDIGAATGGVVVSTAAVRMKMVADAPAAGGNATQNFVDAFCTAASVVVGAWQTQTAPASILTIVPGVGSFDVISTADAGVATMNYVIYK